FSQAHRPRSVPFARHRRHHSRASGRGPSRSAWHGQYPESLLAPLPPRGTANADRRAARATLPEVPPHRGFHRADYGKSRENRGKPVTAENQPGSAQLNITTIIGRWG